MGINRNESACHAILDQLEARADQLAEIWRHGSIEADDADALVDVSLGVVPCLYSGTRGLVPIGNLGEGVSDRALEAFALLLTHAHVLIALARIGLERSDLFQVPARSHCRRCFSTDVLVSRRATGAHGVSCRVCGAEMDEIGPRALPAPPAPGPKAS